MISQGGFFDDSSEWVELDGVQLVLTADNNSNGDGRSISERLTSIMQTTYLAYVPKILLKFVVPGFLLTMCSVAMLS
jgi:hypothetical protein